MKDKDQLGAVVYVDDAPQNIEQLRAHGHYAVCFGNRTNETIAAPRAIDWADVYSLSRQSGRMQTHPRCRHTNG